MPDIVSLSDLEPIERAPVFERDPRVVRLRLDAGEGVPEHSHPGETVVVHVLSGRLLLTVDGEEHGLGGGELIRFDGARPVAIDAPEGGEALVFVAPSAEDHQ